MATEVQIALQPQAGQDPAAALATAAAKLARSTLATLIQQAGQPMTGKIVPPPANLPSGFAQVAVADQLLTLKLSTPLPAGTSVRIDVQPAPNGQPAVTVQPLPQPTAAQPSPAPLPAQTQLPLPPLPPQPTSAGPAPQQASSQAPPTPAATPPAATTTTSSAPTAPTPATAPVPQAAASAAVPRSTPAPQPAPSAPQTAAALQPQPAASPTPAPNAAAPTLSQPGAPTPPVTTTAAPPAPPVAPAPSASAPTPAPQQPQAQQTSPSLQSIPAPTVQAAVSSAQTPAPAAPQPQVAMTAPQAAPPPSAAAPPAPRPSPAPVATSQPAAPATTQPAAPPAAPPQALMQRLTQAFAPPPPATTTPAPAAGSPAQMAMVATTQAAAQQQSAAPLMQALAVALPALPKEVADAAGKVLATRVVLDRGAPTGETLKQAVLSSGVFVDTPKSAGQPDIRQALTQLRGTLLGWLGDDIAPVAALTRRPPPPARGAVPRAQSADLPQPPVETAAKEAGKALLNQTDGALSRLKLMQLTSQPADSARPGVAPQAAPAEWNLEVPMLLGRELTMAQIQIQRDGKGKAEARDRHWRLRFALKFSVIGEVGAQVTMTGTRAAVAIWADEPHTAETLEAMLPELGPALAAKGLDLTSLVVRRGAPRDEAQPVGRLMDSTR